MSSLERSGMQKAVSAGFWNSIDILVRQSIQFIVSVLLARLLGPTDFGIIAVLGFFSGLSQIFLQGLTVALVQRHDTTRDEESAVFWWNMAASLALSAVLLLLAKPVALYFGQPSLDGLMWASAGQIVLTALGAVQVALLTRDLRFAVLVKAGIASSLVSGVVGVAAATLGMGAWALALQMTVAAGLSSAALWALSDWRPRFHLDPASLGRLWRFGSWVSLSTALEVVYTQGFVMVVGKLYGVRELGFYNRAWSTQQLPGNILSLLITRVALPLFSSRAGDPAAVRRGALLAIRVAMMLNLPVMVGLSILSPLVIELLFGAKWLPSAPILSILALAGVLLPLHVINLQLILSRGGSNVFFALEVVKKVVGIVCVGIGSIFGIFGLAWAGLAAAILAFWLNALPNGRALDLGAGRQLIDLSGLALPTGAMAVIVWGGMVRLDRYHLPVAAELAVLVMLGALVYFGIGLGTRSQLFRQVLEIGLEQWRGRRAPVQH